jgi:signal peptidase I
MSWDTNGKGFNKIRWDRVFTTVSGGTTTILPSIFLNRIGRIFLLVNILEKEKIKNI